MTHAERIIDAAAAAMRRQAAVYDKAGGERSAPKVAAMWSAATGRAMSAAEAWLFLVCLKAVRLHDAPGPHDDSAADGASYLALLGEQKNIDAGAKARPEPGATASDRAAAFLDEIGACRQAYQNAVRDVCREWDARYGKGFADGVIADSARDADKADPPAAKTADPDKYDPRPNDWIGQIVHGLRSFKQPTTTVKDDQKRLRDLLKTARDKYGADSSAPFRIRAAWDATFGGGSADLLVGSLPADEWRTQDHFNQAEYADRERLARRNGADDYTDPDPVATPDHGVPATGKLGRPLRRWPAGGDGPIPKQSDDAVAWQMCWVGLSGAWWEIRDGWNEPREFPAGLVEPGSVAPPVQIKMEFDTAGYDRYLRDTLESFKASVKAVVGGAVKTFSPGAMPTPGAVPPVVPGGVPVVWSGDPARVAVEIAEVGAVCDGLRAEGSSVATSYARLIETLLFWSLSYQELYARTHRRMAEFYAHSAFDFMAVRLTPASYARGEVLTGAAARIVGMSGKLVRDHAPPLPRGDRDAGKPFVTVANLPSPPGPGAASGGTMAGPTTPATNPTETPDGTRTRPRVGREGPIVEEHGGEA